MTSDSNVFWTDFGMRFTRVDVRPGSSSNWLFLPGGPGLGSESLSPLTRMLGLPGTLWHLDLPGDGSNTQGLRPSVAWFDGLADAVARLPDTILVAHSTGAMLAFASPIAEASLKGLVVLNSAPDSSWRGSYAKHVAEHGSARLHEFAQSHQLQPSDQSLKGLTLEAAPLLFAPGARREDWSWMDALPFNEAACSWCERNFDETYAAKWVPRKTPTLILSGACDPLTPLRLFSQRDEYRRRNIECVEIAGAGHFPWIENPSAVRDAFFGFSRRVSLGFEQA